MAHWTIIVSMSQLSHGTNFSKNDMYFVLSYLYAGYTIACVNETSVGGYQHKEIVQLIRSSGNILR